MAVFKYGDDINTDMLFPGKYTYTCNTPDEIKPHLLEDIDPEFSSKVKQGDIIIAGKNFGCGSSREQPVVGLKAVGIKAIIAKSFARIFYRAGINQGLILIECPDAVASFKQGGDVKIDLEGGKIIIDQESFSYPGLPLEILAVREAGGLIPYTKKKLRGKR